MLLIPARLLLLIVFVLTVIPCSSAAQSPLASNLFKRGNEFAAASKYDEAIPYLEEATRQATRFTQAWVQLGYCLARVGKIEHSLRVLRRAADLEPESPEVHFHLADALALSGQNREAIASYTEALRLKPDFPDARIGLGLALLAVGDRQSARRQQLLLEVSENKGDRYPALNYRVLLNFISKPGRKHRPFDEAGKNPSLVAFRARLLRAVRERNAAFVLSALDKDVILGADGTSGIDEFKKIWSPYKRDSPVWQAMGRALSGGGAWLAYGRENVFIAPYVFHRFPYEMSGSTVYAVVLGDGIKLYPRPDVGSVPITTLSYDVVILDSERSIYRQETAAREGWYRVVTAAGNVGFVRSPQVSTSSAYYMKFKKVKGFWRVTDFDEYYLAPGG